jgi:hypothetical protein
MNNTHTPAPWKIATFDGPHEYASIEAGDGISELIRVCDIPNWPCAIEEMQANARLIASSPDLLSALESFAVWNDGEPCFCHVHGESERARYTPHDSYCDKAREALRKAKGEA